jgi:hypothetical protein
MYTARRATKTVFAYTVMQLIDQASSTSTHHKGRSRQGAQAMARSGFPDKYGPEDSPTIRAGKAHRVCA